MKKRILTICIIGVCLSGIGCNSRQSIKNQKTNNVSAVNSNVNYSDCIVNSDYEVCNYPELKEDSQVIALVKVMDELSEDNSYPYYSGDVQVDSYSLRKVEVLKYYKDEKNLGNTLTVVDTPAIINGEYSHTENYTGLVKDNLYILFLNDDNGLSKLSILADNNGCISLGNIAANEFFNIAVDALVDLESSITSEEKEAFIKSNITKANSNDSLDRTTTGKIKEANISFDISYKVLDTENITATVKQEP